MILCQARAHDSTVIIVGTHYDEIPPANRKQTVDEYRSILYSRYVSEKLGGGVSSMSEKGLPKVIEVTEVSSKPRSEHNIRELRHLIYDKALSLRDTGKLLAHHFQPFCSLFAFKTSSTNAPL